MFSKGWNIEIRLEILESLRDFVNFLIFIGMLFLPSEKQSLHWEAKRMFDYKGFEREFQALISTSDKTEEKEDRTSKQ